MLLVVADTGPIRYLVQIEQIRLLPILFEKILIPTAVYNELRHASTPEIVREWAKRLPDWLEVVPVTMPSDSSFQGLDEGEMAAIILGQSRLADLILMDDRRGSGVARRTGFEVTGTLGVLVRGSQEGLLDLADAFDRLRQTNFRFRQEMMEALLDQYGGDK